MSQIEASLVKQTPFENLAVRLIEKNSEITKIRLIVREIVSVYCFIKNQFVTERQPLGPLDLEDFKIVREHLHKAAFKEVEIHKKKWWWLGLKPMRIRQWECFLKFGYFDPTKYPYDFDSYLYNRMLLADNLKTILNHTNPMNWYSTPPNLKNLALALFEERFGAKNE